MRNAQNAHTSFLLAAMSAASLAFAIPTTANATVTGGSSSSYGESVSLSITPALLGVDGSVTSGPLPVASGTAPAPYSQTNSLLSATITDLIATGLLNAVAASNVDGSAGAKYASSSASVDELGLSILRVIGLDALDLHAGVIESSAGVSGDYGALSASGDTSIAGLSLNSLPVLTIAPTPNDVLLNDVLGVTVVLNEQTQTGDGIGSAGMAVNAVHITLDNTPYLWGL